MPNAPVGPFVELLVQPEDLARDTHSHSLLGRLADRESQRRSHAIAEVACRARCRAIPRVGFGAGITNRDERFVANAMTRCAIRARNECNPAWFARPRAARDMRASPG
jgi:hypothetical protein